MRETGFLRSIVWMYLSKIIIYMYLNISQLVDEYVMCVCTLTNSMN
jgi:hypothetical protein